jgi:signal transduction histidine kinase
MRALYLRIWLTVVATLALFALATGWLVRTHLEQERSHAEAVLAERIAGWGQLIQSSLPPATAASTVQAEALREWAHRLHVPLALDDGSGKRIAASESFERREAEGLVAKRGTSIRLGDGRQLWMLRPFIGRGRRPEPGVGQLPGHDGSPPGAAPDNEGALDDSLERLSDGARDFGRRLGTAPPPFGFLPHDWPSGLVLVGLLVVLFLAVAAGAYPVVRRLTRRLETLRHGVEIFGRGNLQHRVDATGRDEVAAVAGSFNQAAERIEALLKSNRSLLANASHELRSPLARLKMAVTLLDGASPASQAKLVREVHTDIAELDALVEEVLLSSRLDAGAPMELGDPVDLLGLAVEEASRCGAQVDGEPFSVRGSDRLLRRAVRNLLENAQRYGGGQAVQLTLERDGASGELQLSVLDRGAGVPAEQRERIFEPFYRLPGHAEREGGVGLGLALVRQIAKLHGGQVVCLEREGGGSCFTLSLPAERLLASPTASFAAPRP